MINWIDLESEKPEENGYYLVFGYAGRPLQWIDVWDGNFVRFPYRKSSFWMPIPTNGWQKYPENIPSKSGKYLVKDPNNSHPYRFLSFDVYHPNGPRFLENDEDITAFRELPEDAIPDLKVRFDPGDRQTLFIPPYRSIEVNDPVKASSYATGKLTVFLRSLRGSPEIASEIQDNPEARISALEFPEHFQKKSGYLSDLQFIGIQEPFCIYDGSVYYQALPKEWPVRFQNEHFQLASKLPRFYVRTFLKPSDIALVRLSSITDEEYHQAGTSRLEFYKQYPAILKDPTAKSYVGPDPYVWLIKLKHGGGYNYTGMVTYLRNQQMAHYNQHVVQHFPDKVFVEPELFEGPIKLSKMDIKKFEDLISRPELRAY